MANTFIVDPTTKLEFVYATTGCSLDISSISNGLKNEILHLAGGEDQVEASGEHIPFLRVGSVNTEIVVSFKFQHLSMQGRADVSLYGSPYFAVRYVSRPSTGELGPGNFGEKLDDSFEVTIRVGS